MKIEGFRERLQSMKGELVKSDHRLSHSEASALAATGVLEDMELELFVKENFSEAGKVMIEIDRRQNLIVNSPVFDGILKDEEDRLGEIVGKTDELYEGLE